MTARTILLAVSRLACSPNQFLFSDAAPFMSVCPTCEEPRLQMGYSRWGLHRRLNSAWPIEACCVTCHRFWPIALPERVVLAKELEYLQLS